MVTQQMNNLKYQSLIKPDAREFDVLVRCFYDTIKRRKDTFRSTFFLSGMMVPVRDYKSNSNTTNH
jgi:hypothetical protein